jgi:hypothetical protein
MAGIAAASCAWIPIGFSNVFVRPVVVQVNINPAKRDVQTTLKKDLHPAIFENKNDEEIYRSHNQKLVGDVTVRHGCIWRHSGCG